MDSLIFENPDLNNNSGSEQSPKAKQQDAIDFSNMLLGLFEDMSEGLEGVSIEDLKIVYRQSELSHRENRDYNLNAWGLARVNMFIRQKTEGSIAEIIPALESVSVDKIQSLEFEEPLSSIKEHKLEYIDATEDWIPSREDFELAEQYVKKYDLKFTFSSLNDLYIEEYKPLELELE